MGVFGYVAAGAAIATTMLTLTMLQPSEVEHQSQPLDSTLANELKELRSLLSQQQEASERNAKLVRQLKDELARGDALDAPAGATPPQPAAAVAATASAALSSAAPSAAALAAEVRAVAAAEAKALSRCTEADVPILALLRKPCADGRHGYGCTERWGMADRYLPTPSRWLAEWNASARSVVRCQRGFFDALAARFTAAHWEVEWDAQPFRISAVPPRTIGAPPAPFFFLSCAPFFSSCSIS